MVVLAEGEVQKITGVRTGDRNLKGTPTSSDHGGCVSRTHISWWSSQRSKDQLSNHGYAKEWPRLTAHHNFQLTGGRDRYCCQFQRRTHAVGPSNPLAMNQQRLSLVKHSELANTNHCIPLF